jgi:hypothetical protein
MRFARMTLFGEPLFKVSQVFRGVLPITMSHRDRKESAVDLGRPFSSNIKENTRL